MSNSGESLWGQTKLWERFSERAKHVVVRAREEAIRLGSENIWVDHILLGLCNDPNSVAVRALKNLQVDIKALAMEAEQRVQRLDCGSTSDDPAFTPRAKKVFTLAVECARTFCFSYIGTEHILLGLVKDEDGISSRVFQDLKIDFRQVHAEIMRILDDDKAHRDSTGT